MRALLSMMVILAGCASGGASETITRGTPTTTTVETSAGNYDLQMTPESRTRTDWIATPRDRVWAALPGVYESLGITVATVEEEAGVFGNRNLRVSRIAGERLSRFFDCGRNPIGAPVANTGTLQLEIVTRIQASGGGTDVTNTLVARARSRSGSASEVQCMSTGALEALILARIAELTSVPAAVTDPRAW